MMTKMSQAIILTMEDPLGEKKMKNKVNAWCDEKVFALTVHHVALSGLVHYTLKYCDCVVIVLVYYTRKYRDCSEMSW
jgi:hypothetical protein